MSRLKMFQLSLLLTAGLLSLCVGEVFHVTPTLPATRPCPPPCHTLDQYVQKNSLLTGHSNISLIFLEGVHTLSYNLTINMINSTDNSLLEFQGQGVLPGDTAIKLLPSVSIDLSDITHVRLKRIYFMGDLLKGYIEEIFFMGKSVKINNCLVTSSEYQVYFTDLCFYLAFDLIIRNSTLSGGPANGDEYAVVGIEGGHTTLIQNTDVSISGVGIISIFVDNVTIEDCTLSGGQIGVGIDGGSSALIQRTNVTGIFNVGLAFSSLDNVTIDDCVLSDGWSGIWVESVSNTLIQSTNVSNMPSMGFGFTSVDKVAVKDCILSGGQIGVGIDGGSSALIQRTNMTDTFNVSLALSSLDNVTIEDCVLSNGDIGLAIIEGSNAIIQSTAVTHMSSVGLAFSFLDNVTIDDCVLSDGWNGIWVNSVSNTLIQGTNVSNMFSVGLGFTSADNVAVKDCILSGGWIGLGITEGSGAIIQSTVVTHMSNVGLGFSSVYNVTIEDCALSDGDIGIEINGGYNALIQRTHSFDMYGTGLSFLSVGNVAVEGCTFSGGWYEAEILRSAGGFGFFSVDNVTIKDCTLSGGAGWVLIAIENGFSAVIQRTTVSDMPGRGLQFMLVDNVAIENCTFSNGFTGITVNGELSSIAAVRIERTVVSGMFGSGLEFLYIENVTITESLIEHSNTGTLSYSSCLNIYRTIFSSNQNGGLRILDTLLGTVLTDCSFHSNLGSAIILNRCIIELRGETVFRDNTAERGGGIALFRSVVYFGLDSNTTFNNNTAESGGGLALFDSEIVFDSGSNTAFIHNRAEEFGGAVFVNPMPNMFSTDIKIYDIRIINLVEQRCFFSVNNESDITVHFSKNQARLGGFDIHGVLLNTEECSLKKKIFNFHDNSSFQFSSDPTRVCFCINNVSQCENIVLNETRYPGETFTISVVLTGYDSRRVAGSVYNNVLGRDYKQVISESQHQQTAELLECTDISYTISSRGEDSVELVLSAEDGATEHLDETYIRNAVRNAKCLGNNIYGEVVELQTLDTYPCAAFRITPVFVNVTLENCTLGFELTETDGVCDCDKDLRDIGLTCQIRDRTGYINREGTVWVGVDTSENNTDIYYWHRYCPKDYCIPNLTVIDLRSPDEQCSSNRSGMMCGRCQTNYSLQLGGNKCIHCYSNNLSLLIVFIAFGILLVALIKLSNLTVTSGTISGLIFYANVVWRNNAILFSSQDKQNIGYYIVILPIAWINLDFGIETCFSENLDQLTKTGLQFVFPVYIWCIAGLIIIISRYSIRATKLFGNNSVAVLATLFLLSYGKLFRTITDVFTFADLTDSNGIVHRVWFLDGNVRYGETPGHIVLLILALLFLFLFILPFTLVLLLVPFLRAKSYLRPLHWINTLKPLFDTYYGPFKDKKQHQVWTGILLISRVVILIVFASTSTYSPNGNIVVMGLIAALLLLYSATVGLLYKKWSLSLLENIYIINLVFLGATFTLQDTTTKSLSPVPTISVVLALFTLVCTFIGYAIKQAVLTLRVKMEIQFNIRQNCEYAPDPLDKNINDNEEFEQASIKDGRPNNYTGDASTRSQEGKPHPPKYDPPIIQSALIVDRLREPALDILDPVTADHYREVTRRRQPDPPPRQPTTHIIDKPIRQAINLNLAIQETSV